jgi:hypothetical protein
MRRAYSHAIYGVFAALASTVVLTACAGNLNSGAPVGAGPQAAASTGKGVIQNDAGQYSGTVTDTVLGTGTGDASLAQDEHVVGGVLNASFGSTSIANSFAAQTNAGTSLAGAEVANTNSGVCSFSMNATYDTSKHILNGTYQAVHGCSGESGSFKLTKECYYPRKGLLDAAPSLDRTSGMKPDNGLHQC